MFLFKTFHVFFNITQYNKLENARLDMTTESVLGILINNIIYIYI